MVCQFADRNHVATRTAADGQQRVFGHHIATGFQLATVGAAYIAITYTRSAAGLPQTALHPS